MRSEELIIQLQNEVQRLQRENDIIDTALFNAFQTICRSLNFNQNAIIKMKDTYINRVRNNYAMTNIEEQVRNRNFKANTSEDISFLDHVIDEIIELEDKVKMIKVIDKT